MELKGDLVYNKDIWMLISSTFVNVTNETVTNELNRAEKQLFHGINYYKKSTPEDPKRNELKNALGSQICSFVRKLEMFIDISFVQAYDLLCYYVMYEFRGSVDGMHELIANEMKTRMLIQDIWLFYRSERMFLLRCVNLIWSYYSDADHPFHKHYESLLSQYSVEDWFNAHSSQLRSVTTERLPTSATHGSYMTERFQDVWFLSNLREQIQVIHNVILYLDFYNCSAGEFETLYHLCQSHTFGRDQQTNIHLNLSKEHIPFIEKIGCMESIMLLQAMDLETLNLHTHKLYAADAELFERLNKEIAIQGTSEEQGPLLLAWMIVSFQHPTKDPTLGQYKRFGEKAVELDVFNYLAKLLKSTMFQNGTKLGVLAYGCVYNLLVCVCESFSGEILVSLPGICVAVAAVLADPTVKRLFWQSAPTSGLWGIVQEAIKHFPYQYYPLVGIAQSLAVGGRECMPQLMDLLLKLPSYMESVSLMAMTSIVETMPLSGTFRLKIDRQPPDSLVILPAGTLGHTLTSMGEPTVVWKCPVDFFDVLVKVETTLVEQISCGTTSVQEESMKRAVAAIKCLASLLEFQCDIPPKVSDAISQVFQLMEKYSAHPGPPSELLGSCMDVCCALLLSFPAMVTHRMESINFLPTIDTLLCSDPIELARGSYFRLNTVGLVMANDECLSGKYPLLLAYLRFLDRVMQPNRDDTFEQTLQKNFDIILPGIVLIVRIVFPNYENWPFEDELMDMNQVWLAHYCMQAMHLLVSLKAAEPDMSDLGPEQQKLEKSRDPIRRTAPHFLHTVCLYSLLETDTCLPLLRLVATGDRYLQAMMEHQPSWVMGYGILYISNVQLAMSVLNRVLMLKRTLHPGPSLCKMETLLYCQPTPSPLLPPLTSKLRVVLVVANYIYHCFNPALTILSVRLLKRFALEFPISLMSCLGVDGQQICQTFLGRLKSVAECAEMKVAILELITASVATQPGFTEAFINLHNPLHTQRYERGGCLNYACDTMRQILVDPTSVPLSVHQAVIALIYELWVGETQSVLAFLRAKEDFWDGLCEPFQLEFIEQESTVYCQILTILTLEVFWHHGKLERQLRANLDKFVFCSLDRLQPWCKFLLSMVESKTEEGKPKPIVEGLLIAWKEFLTVMIRFPSAQVDTDNKKIVGSTISCALVQQLEDISNPNAIKLLADTYLLLVTNWKEDSWDDLNMATVQLQQILLHMSTNSIDLPPLCNESLLALSIRLIHLLGAHIRTDETLVDSMMQSGCIITSTELLLVKNRIESVMREHEKAVEEASTSLVPGLITTRRSPLTCSLSVVVLQRLLCCTAGTHLWARNFHESKLVIRLLDVAAYALETEPLFELATILIDTLLLLSYTEFSKTVMLFNTSSKLWMKLLPPSGLGCPWYETRWVEMYCSALKLVTNMLETQQHFFVEEACAFVAIHEDCIVGLLRGIRTTTTTSVLQLSVLAIDLVRLLLQYKSIWQFYHEQSYTNIINGVMAACDTCAAFLVQPYVLYAIIERPLLRTLQDLRNLEATDLDPSPRMVRVQNKLLEVACMCLMAIRPLCGDFMEVLAEPRDCMRFRTEVLIDLSFATPHSRKKSLGPLSFGTLITLANLTLRGLTFKTAQSPGSSPLRHIAFPSTCPTDKWLSALDKDCMGLTLEITLATILTQGLLVLEDTQMQEPEAKQVGREIISEMATFFEWVKRYLDEGESKSNEVLKRPVFARRTCARRLSMSPPPDDMLTGVKQSSIGDQMEDSTTRTKVVFGEQQAGSPIRGDQPSFRGEVAPARFKTGNFSDKDGPSRIKQITIVEPQADTTTQTSVTTGVVVQGRPRHMTLGKHKDETPTKAKQSLFGEHSSKISTKSGEAVSDGDEMPTRLKQDSFRGTSRLTDFHFHSPTKYSVFTSEDSPNMFSDLMDLTPSSSRSVSPLAKRSPSLKGSPLAYMQTLTDLPASPSSSEESHEGSLQSMPDSPQSDAGAGVCDDEQKSNKFFQLMAHIFQCIFRQI